LISTKVADFPTNLQEFRSALSGRSMLVKKNKAFTRRVHSKGLYSRLWVERVQRNGICLLIL